MLACVRRRCRKLDYTSSFKTVKLHAAIYCKAFGYFCLTKHPHTLRSLYGCLWLLKRLLHSTILLNPLVIQPSWPNWKCTRTEPHLTAFRTFKRLQPTFWCTLQGRVPRSVLRAVTIVETSVLSSIGLFRVNTS